VTRRDVPSLDAWAERACLAVRRRSKGHCQPRPGGELTKAANVLETFNRWRRGEDVTVASPEAIGKALDIAIEILNNASKDAR
jgi:hypothetical protein